MFRELELGVFTGNAHPELAEQICRYLGTPLGKAEVFQFSNENIFVRILENVRNHDVFIVQPLSTPVNTSLMELLIMIDAVKRASASRITAVVPYYAYARTDKKDQPRVPITARLLADLITVAGASRLLTVDLHAGQIQGFFSIPVDELTALNLIARYFEDRAIEDLVVVSPDVGFVRRARDLASMLDAPLAIIEKRRTGNNEPAQALHIIGEVAGKRALVVDDEIDTGATVVSDTEVLLDGGARDVSVACTHPIFSGSAPQRLAEAPIKEVVVTDTVPVPDHKRFDKLTVLSTAPLLGEAISRIHEGRSVGAMFED